MRRRAVAIAIAATAVLLVSAAAPAGALARDPPARLTIVTLPKLVGIRFALDGRTFVTGRSGYARIRTTPGTHLLQALDTTVRRPGTRSTFLRWSDGRFTGTRTIRITGDTRLYVGYRQSVRVSFRFVDPAGHPVVGRVTRLTLSSTLGGQPSFQPEWPQWLPAISITRRIDGLGQTLVRYSIRQALVGGSNVVNQAQQRFYPALTRQVTARLLLYSARVSVRDFLLGTSAGSRLQLVYPNGTRAAYSLHGKELRLSSLPRGTYQVDVQGGGYAPTVSLALSRNQVLKVRVISYLDMFLFLLIALAAVAALALVARPYLRLRIRSLGTGRQPTLDDLEPIKPLPGARKALIVRYMVPSPAVPQRARGAQRLPVRSAPEIAVRRVEDRAAPPLRTLPRRMWAATVGRLRSFQDPRRRIRRPLRLPAVHREPPREALTGERIELVHVYMGETIAPAATVAAPPSQEAQRVEAAPAAPVSETTVAPPLAEAVPPEGEPSVAEPAEPQQAPKPKRTRTPAGGKTPTRAKAKTATAAKKKAVRAGAAKPKAKTTKAKPKTAKPKAAPAAAAQASASEGEPKGQDLAPTPAKEETPTAPKRSRPATKAKTVAPAKRRTTRATTRPKTKKPTKATEEAATQGQTSSTPVAAEGTAESQDIAQWPDLAAAVEALREDLRNARSTAKAPAKPKAARSSKKPKTKKATEATEEAAVQGPASPPSAAANGVANIEELAQFRPDLAAAVEALQGDLRNARTATTKKGRRKSSAEAR